MPGSKSRVSSVKATTLTLKISPIRTGSARSKRPRAPSPALLIENVDLEAARRERLGEFAGGAGPAQIGGDHRGRRTSTLELGGERLHRRRAARGQHQVVAVAGQFAGKLAADAAGGAGDEGERPGGRGHWRDLFAHIR